ncbi:basic proline-rich protein [Cucurbita moschata]|uniref:Basic proline-rich protein n=1 Tax=Cucurbita moschata TaxID=3662 RepID=A0A6J1GN96_CUCMO|nr:basic proline-rich protein [Cucurbita moschata]
MASHSTFRVLVPLVVAVMVMAMADATPPGIAKNPSHASCKIKKYKHCYNLDHVCPKFCPDQCTVECASCKPICGGDASPPPEDDPTPATPSPPSDNYYSPPPPVVVTPSPPPSEPTPSYSPPLPSPTPVTPSPSPPTNPTPPSTPPTHSYPPENQNPPSSPPTSPNPPTPSTPSTPPASPNPPSTPPTHSYPPENQNPPSSPPTSPNPPTPSTPSNPNPPSTPPTHSYPPGNQNPPSTPPTSPNPPTPSTPSSPNPPSTPPTHSYPPGNQNPPSNPNPPPHSNPPENPNPPSTPPTSPNPPTPSTPSTPPTHSYPPGNPNPPSTPPPSSSAGAAKRVRCKNANYPQCYNMIHTCPSACPNGCQVDCVTCKPVCHCDRPGAVCQDPRFIGGDGITFYFHGQKDKDFCLVSDPNLHINAHFIGKRNPSLTRDFTWVQSLGILFNTHRLLIAAQKTAVWDDSIDRLTIALDDVPVALPESEGSQWQHPTENPTIVIVRLGAANHVMVEAKGLFRITAKVVPITEEDSRVHSYGIDEGDSFAHLDVGFKFFELSGGVNGVLGQTYGAGYVSNVNLKAAMPVMGREKEFETSSLFAADCAVARFGSDGGDDDGNGHEEVA